MYKTFNNDNISSFRSSNNNNKIPSLKLSLNTPSKFTIYDSNNKNSRNFYSSNFTNDTSTNFSPLKTTNFSLLTLENKIKLVNEKRNKNLEEKKLFFENERKKKEQKLLHYYKILKNKNLINLNSNNERKKKQLKIKINHIINKNQKKNCESYDNKISSFNIKIFDFLQGNHNTIQNYKYCKNFHFDKNTNNFEAHDRYKMIIDNNNNNNVNNNKCEDMINFKTILNKKEIKMVNEEPAYFFDNNYNYKYKVKSLTERMIDEEQNEKKKKRKNNLLIDFNFKPEKKYKEQNIEEKINDVKNIIKHNIYNYKTIQLKQNHNDFNLQKILKKMNNEINNIKKENIINYDIETLKDLFEKSDRKFKNHEKKFLSPQNKRKFNFFALFNFNQNDQDFIKKYNSLIKNGYKL